ncbi:MULTISPECIES: sodium:solute symporter family transporter [unclassified Lentimonas]|uniref:sodium:solute symporter family transporter n=1 Tax=unclassified Lentimonas TaxID=2630993 RepID=UPI0013242ED8|nr:MULTISPECIES: hypothetical protein [unclassified Lentimonas]CAA6679264.1 Unannotated [Lentimonas sp. CC4]CAA6686298.1 Unannotated [Lentimonas sp. CC6]CAA6695220.1 Unannotated [Lentimonas sp. CC19]CAA6697324.1 Unannotated [Lentimonas sp. CC10]CAA7070410.1 Unannotated [Lentimonas sp. CC11]
MHWIDYTVIITALLGITLYGSMFAKKAGGSTDEFILGGRKMPWWLAGASVVATGFNASTPLSDARKIRTDGFSGLWFTWQGIIVGSLATIFFSRLWRRSRLTTAVEFYDIRYSGKAAQCARTYDVAVLGIINGCIWSAIGLVAMKKIARVMFGLPEYFAVAGLNIPSDWVVVIGTVILALTYASASGVYGVVWTDLVELIIAVGASYYLFFFVFKDVGWNVGLRDSVLGLEDGMGTKLLSMVPEFGPALIVLWFIQPLISLGNINPGVQRMLTVKDEREVLYTHYFSTIANFVIKPWPFLICGLASIFLISDASLIENWNPITDTAGNIMPDYEMAYPELVTQYMPVGLLGLMVASFLFAFMSSLDTNIHISGSLFVNDLYRPYLVKDKSPKHYVKVTRIFMSLLTVSSVLVAVFVEDILMLMIFAMTVHNSSGLIKPLRWIWWRANGIAEIYGQAAGLIMVVLIFFTPVGANLVAWIGELTNSTHNDAFYAIRVMCIVSVSSLASLFAIYFHGPEPKEKLDSFYRRLRPYGYWGPVADRNPDSYHGDSMPLLWGMTIVSLSLAFGAIFTSVGFFLALWTLFTVSAVITVLSAVGVIYCMRKLYPKGHVIEEDTSFGAS